LRKSPAKEQLFTVIYTFEVPSLEFISDNDPENSFWEMKNDQVACVRNSNRAARQDCPLM
jgi:hypothetical protein